MDGGVRTILSLCVEEALGPYLTASGVHEAMHLTIYDGVASRLSDYHGVSARCTNLDDHSVAGVAMQHTVATSRDQQGESVASPPTPLKGGRVQRSLQRSPATLGERKFDLIRVEGNGERPEGYRARLYRNGELVPGLVEMHLDIDVRGAQYLTTKQIVILEKDEDVVERATQALEEREQAWSQES